ncbi:hypothetical protein HDV02_006738 [Globomyces sp. JEL0801]|nr:hypothetical protein HDV02_006738 [Globomyces sp. JEL0801]
MKIIFSFCKPVEEPVTIPVELKSKEQPNNEKEEPKADEKQTDSEKSKDKDKSKDADKKDSKDNIPKQPVNETVKPPTIPRRVILHSSFFYMRESQARKKMQAAKDASRLQTLSFPTVPSNTPGQ